MNELQKYSIGYPDPVILCPVCGDGQPDDSQPLFSLTACCDECGISNLELK